MLLVIRLTCQDKLFVNFKLSCQILIIYFIHSCMDFELSVSCLFVCTYSYLWLHICLHVFISAVFTLLSTRVTCQILSQFQIILLILIYIIIHYCMHYISNLSYLFWVHILICGSISACICSNRWISAGPRSCVWPWMDSMYDLVITMT